MTLKDVTQHLDADRLLDVMGLQTKHSSEGWLAGILTAFGVGLLVGAGVGLMLAPKAGRGLREDMRDRLRQASDGNFSARIRRTLTPTRRARRPSDGAQRPHHPLAFAIPRPSRR